MAISRMQEPRQLYGLGSLVKKAVRGVKKLVKSPLGKAALIGGLGMIPFGATNASLFSRLGGALGSKGIFGTKVADNFIGPMQPSGFLPSLKKFGLSMIPGTAGFSGKNLALGLGATAVATPFLQKAFKMGPYEEVEETYRHKETGEIFKEKKDWEAKGYKPEEMAQDVKVVMPPLDLFSKTK